MPPTLPCVHLAGHIQTALKGLADQRLLTFCAINWACSVWLLKICCMWQCIWQRDLNTAVTHRSRASHNTMRDILPSKLVSTRQSSRKALIEGGRVLRRYRVQSLRQQHMLSSLLDSSKSSLHDSRTCMRDQHWSRSRLTHIMMIRHQLWQDREMILRQSPALPHAQQTWTA